MKDWNQALDGWLQTMGVAPENVIWGNLLVGVLGMLLVAYLMTKIFRYFVIPAVHKITARTKATWDDYLFNADMMRGFCRMIPPVVIYPLLPIVLQGFPYLLMICEKGCLVYAVVRALQLVNTFFRSLYEYSNEHESLRNRPLKGIYQMINILAIGVGAIFIISILIDRNATSILAGLGASAAVLMLIFRDSILGLVAGVQLSANDMLRPGDWITMSKYGADGYVIEVSLTTVKVQNFDKTITTIPPYALVSDSFQNWRGMWETGARRIKRSLYIDMNTVHFCTPVEVEKFIREGFLPESERGKKVVNLHVFRLYALHYIKEHPEINHELMQMVRQLQPTTEGLPIEIYCFAHTSNWIEYENIQSELFDYLLAMISQFNLKVFQRPSGNDFAGKMLNEGERFIKQPAVSESFKA